MLYVGNLCCGKHFFLLLEYVFLDDLEKLIPELFTNLSQLSSLFRILVFLFLTSFYFLFFNKFAFLDIAARTVKTVVLVVSGGGSARISSIYGLSVTISVFGM